MLRPTRDYTQFRPGLPPAAPPPLNGPMGAGMNMPPMNAPMNVPMNMPPPPYAPPPMGFVRPPVSGGHFAYPPPPPTPVPSPHLGPFLPSLQAPPFVPPLPPTPPVEAPPPPPPPPPPTPPPSIASEPSHPEQITALKQTPLPLPAQPSKPHDLEILKNIEGMAEFVVKNGPRYESMARAKHAGDPKFAFLFENDSGPEAVTNRDYYNWKKEVLKLQLETASESKFVKLLDSDNDPSWNSRTSLKAQQRGEVPGSPSVSDMDMEDDLDAPSPRRDSTTLSSMASGGVTDSPETVLTTKPLGPLDTLEKDVLQPVEKSDSLNKGKQAQCRLTGDYTGALIDNYMSDISEDSEDLEPSMDAVMTEGREATAQASNEEVKLSKQESSESMSLPDASSSEATKHLIVSEDSEHKILEPEGSEDKCENQTDMAHVEIFEKGVVPTTIIEYECQQSRKRSRSRSRSRSKSPSRSHSQSPRRTRSRSRSASRSHEDRSKSPSPARSALHNTLSRSPPNDLSSKNAERGDFEVATRPKRGVKGGANICLNFARGRCFRGDSCRLQHQGGDKMLQGVEKVLEPEESDTPMLTVSSQNLEKESAPEVDNNEGPSAEVAASKKAKRKAGDKKMESSAEREEAKRLESRKETAKMSGVPSHEDGSVTPHLSMQSDAGRLSPSEAAHSTPIADRLHLKASHASEVGVRSPLVSSETSMQVTENYGSSNEAFRFHNHKAVQFPAFAGVSPSLRPSIATPTSNAYLNSNSEAERTYENNFPGRSGQFSSSALGDSTGFHRSSHGNPGMIQSASSRNSTHEYTDLARNYASSCSQEYGLPSPVQLGTAQNTIVPPPVYPPNRQQHDFSSDTTRGYTPLQHGYTSPFSLPVQQHESFRRPPFPGDSSRQSAFSDVANHDPYGIYSRSSFTFTSQSQSYTPWGTSRSSGIPSSKVSEMQSVLGTSSSYSYALTTIPPLPSIIELPGSAKPSNPSDQYDPLSDSLEPSASGGSKSSSFGLLKTVEDGKPFGAFASTLASQLENVSPGFDVGKGDPAEAAGDPAVGIVENVSPPEDNRYWSPGQPVEAVEAKQGQLPPKNRKNNSRGLKLLRSAVADHVKEVLKPTWKEGHMSKDAFKNIVKKAVDKVTAALPPHHIPKSQEKVDQFMSSSRSKISKLVQGYIDKYQKI